MKPAAFRYHAPRTEEEALAILAAVAPEDGRILAGGQSLMPTMAFRMARPAHLVDINGVAAFGLLAAEGDVLRIGPCVRHAMLGAPLVGGPLGALLGTVRRHIAHLPIRTRGTFCGSLAHADPASEWCLVSATLGAEMVLRSVGGTRRVAAAEFFQGIMTTALAADEMLVEARLPLLAEGTRSGFYEFSRRPGDFAQAMAIATFTLDGGVMSAPRLGLGGVEDRPCRLPAAEAMLDSQPPSAALFAAVAAAALPGVVPMTDDPHRLRLAETAIIRALSRAAGLPE